MIKTGVNEIQGRHNLFNVVFKLIGSAVTARVNGRNTHRLILTTLFYFQTCIGNKTC